MNINTSRILPLRTFLYVINFFLLLFSSSNVYAGALDLCYRLASTEGSRYTNYLYNSPTKNLKAKPINNWKLFDSEPVKYCYFDECTLFEKLSNSNLITVGKKFRFKSQNNYFDCIAIFDDYTGKTNLIGYFFSEDEWYGYGYFQLCHFGYGPKC